MPLFTSTRVLDVEEPIRGGFVGTTFVASWQEDGKDLLARWSAPGAAPELVTPLGPRIVALAPSPAGAQVALAGIEASGERVELLVAALAPPSGLRLIQPSAGLVLEKEPRLLWSGGGRRLAFGGLLGTSADHVLTMVFDLSTSPPRTSVVFGRPAQWQGETLCVSLGEAFSAWDAEEDREVAWDGVLRFVAPDGAATVAVAPDGAVTIAAAGESARPLVSAPSSIAWLGPHHLATDDGRALDVLTRRADDVLPRRGRARLIALAERGTAGVFEQDGAYVWAT